MNLKFMETVRKKFMLLSIILFMDVCLAYETTTHEEFTEKSYNGSVLMDEELLEMLGVMKDDVFETGELSKYTEKAKRNENGVVLKSPLNIMRSGATFEDDGGRALNHFFDPYHESSDTINHAGGYVSPLWALEHTGGQECSYSKARTYLYDALTAVREEDRDQNFSDLFRSLGQVIHHIQDMAQPQHVRKDSHLKLDWFLTS